MQDSYMIQDMYTTQHDQTMELPSMEYKMVCNICYPEIYYRVQPFVMSVCDQMDYGNKKILSQEMLYDLSDTIYENVCAMHPDLVEYANCREMMSSVESTRRDMDSDPFRGDRDRDRDRDGRRDRGFFPFRRFRRGGLFPDFIDVLLLNELLRRGRIF